MSWDQLEVVGAQSIEPRSREFGAWEAKFGSRIHHFHPNWKGNLAGNPTISCQIGGNGFLSFLCVLFYVFSHGFPMVSPWLPLNCKRLLAKFGKALRRRTANKKKHNHKPMRLVDCMSRFLRKKCLKGWQTCQPNSYGVFSKLLYPDSDEKHFHCVFTRNRLAMKSKIHHCPNIYGPRV